MNTKIKNRFTIYVVERITDDAGWLLSDNIKAFSDKEAAQYYANRLNDKNEDMETSYQVSTLELLLEMDQKKERSCPYGAKCNPSLWGDEMCQKCETKGL